MLLKAGLGLVELIPRLFTALHASCLLGGVLPGLLGARWL